MLYVLKPATGEPRVRLGSELIAGITLETGIWIVEPAPR